MTMIPWEPFPELMSLRRAMDKLFEESFVRPSRLVSLTGEVSAVPIDMYQTANEVVVKTALPGVKPEEVDITISGDTLSIKDETKVEEQVKREEYFCQECRYGSFSRSIRLPAGLNADKAEAKFENVILTLTIPKAEEAKPKTIKVKAEDAVEEKKD